MHESEDDIERLQRLLDRCHASAGAHLASIFDPSRRPSAVDLAHTLPGIFEMHLGVVTPRGAPLVAPIDALLFQGWICFSVPQAAVRAKYLRRDPRLSASYSDGDFALIVHGCARELHADEPFTADFAAHVEREYVQRYGPSWLDWRRGRDLSGFTARIEPHALYAKW